jgi:hypothetical protein
MSGGVITGSFVFNREKGYRSIYEDTYLQLLTEMFWTNLVKVHNTDSKSERFEWLIQSSSIRQATPADGGESVGPMDFEELSTAMLEIAPARFDKGYRISKMKWLNLLNKGMDPVADWVRQQGEYAAYMPQRELCIAIMNGGAAASLSYDGVPFFATNHPNHPNIAANGSYANDLTGVASGSYPGACPIDESVTVDVAFKNLAKALAYISGSISLPNGEDPRRLKPVRLYYPPRMWARVIQITSAKFIAQAAATGGGGADVEKVMQLFAMLEPVRVDEFDGNRTLTSGPPGFGVSATGDDKTYYIETREARTSTLGAFLMNNRQPFVFRTYSGEAGAEGIDAILGRSQSLEWQHDGYFSINYGHPYGLFRCQGS